VLLPIDPCHGEDLYEVGRNPLDLRAPSHDLAQGQRVANGDWLEPDERAKRLRLASTLDSRRVAPDGVGSIEDQRADARPGAGAHGEDCGPHERVVASTDVLQVDDEDVDLREIFGLR
jgi:hypothetical protein